MSTHAVPNKWSKCTISKVGHEDGIDIARNLGFAGLPAQYIQDLDQITITQVPLNPNQQAFAKQRLGEIISRLHEQTSVVFEGE